jgi:ketosteroid isomerase-like protein
VGGGHHLSPMQSPLSRHPHPTRYGSASQDDSVTDREAVRRWVAAYERAWRKPGTDDLSSLFTAHATYLHSPYEEPVEGLEAIRQMWEQERDGPDEVFALSTEIVAVEGETAVVRAEVKYGQPVHQEYRDLWVLCLESAGRCSSFEEWAYWPGRPYSAHDDPRSGRSAGRDRRRSQGDHQG